MEIRDVLHGSIPIEAGELPVIDSRNFQRLRQIKQLGFAEHSFPSATHNRYIHSLGAMHTAGLALKEILGESPEDAGSSSASFSGAAGGARPSGLRPSLRAGAAKRLRAVTRLAALLHDIGHGPLSHTTEFAMPDVRELKLPSPIATPRKARQATHEDYTLKILLDSSLTPLLEKAGSRVGFRPIHIAALIDSTIELSSKDADFFTEPVDGGDVDFRPLLSQLISSEIDADRMDYLRRDSLHCGVSYGQFDFDWLITNLGFHIVEKGGAARAYLSLEHRALYAFEDFLISRFHMFLMVYFHYKSVVYDRMLGQYFESPDCSYSLPADIEKYCESDDAQLSAHLSRSSNEWARRIAEKRPYRMLVELHSGIPATRTAAEEQLRLLRRLERELGAQKIHYLVQTSTGELSKYFSVARGGRPANPIFVRYDNHYSAPSHIPLEQCTDLFHRYGEKRSITRLYVSPENYAVCRHQGRNRPLRYEDEGAATGSPASRSDCSPDSVMDRASQ